MGYFARKNFRKLYNERTEIDPSFFPNDFVSHDATPIDVVIPLVEKDLAIATHCIKSIRTFVNHKIHNVYIVSPPSEKIKHFAKTHDCHYIDENTVLPSPAIKKYGGWVIQQFVKLEASRFVSQKHYLVVDADTIFLRPVVFKSDENYLINVHVDMCKKRKKWTAQALKKSKIHLYDFVTHHMLFSTDVLSDMKKYIEEKHDKPWYDVLLDISEGELKTGFSEYELYMNYLIDVAKMPYRLVSSANMVIFSNMLDKLDDYRAAFSATQKSASLHHFYVF